MRTANPALNAETFKNLAYGADRENAMTIQGTVNKTGILLTLTLIAATWGFGINSSPAALLSQ
jgi:uncharacterized YccA/Bax inhibitor family protein